jgi:tRNA 2-thiouridine synthesizing protein A
VDGVAGLPYLAGTFHRAAAHRPSEEGALAPPPMADKLLDARHLKCPLPIMKAKRAIDSIDVGATLEVLATDPGAPDDFVAFAEATGHALVGHERQADGVFRFFLRRAH